MERSSDLLLLLLFFLLFYSTIIGHRVGANETGTAPVGFVFDLDTSAGKRSWTSISMAIEEFYTANSNHKTRVVLHVRNSNQDIVGAASAEDRLVSKLSMVVVIIWVFVVLILTSSYMASLTSLLTVQQFKPIVADVEELVKNGDYVGYHAGSFVLKILQQMKFPESKLKKLNTLKEYAEALSKGSNKGGVDAIFDEIPYLKLLISKHCGEYTFVGETYRTDGFGFAFQRGSPLVSDMSRAVLNVTESNIMTEITQKWFGDSAGCPSKSSSDSIRLDSRNFGGLFIVTSSVSSFALILFFAEFFYRERKELSAAGEASGGSLRKRLIAWARYFYSKDTRYNNSRMEEEDEAEEDVVVRDVNENEPTVAEMDDDRSQSLYSNSSDVNLVPLDEGVSSTVPETQGTQRPQDEAASSIEMSVQ